MSQPPASTSSSPATLRVFTDPRCLEHRAPVGYPEREERLVNILERLRSDGFAVVEGASHEATEQRIGEVHDPDYVERFRRAVDRGDGLLDSADNPLSPGTWNAAIAAVDTALTASDWVLGAPRRRAFVAVRPPGHHAERARAMGFCYFSTAAIAAQHLHRAHGLDRVAVFDFDVHHGNGTQHLFEDRAEIFFVSTHQFPFYPGTGAADERGTGAGEGATLNVPLSVGSGDDDYQRAFAKSVLPALRRARPQALVISAGFDVWRGDPLGGMGVTAAGLESWGRQLAHLADEVCDGRLISLLEGGYALGDLGRLAASYLHGIAAVGGETPTNIEV